MAMVFKPAETNTLMGQIKSMYEELITTVPTAFETFKTTVKGVWHHNTEAAYEQIYANYIKDSLKGAYALCVISNGLIVQAAETINNAGSGSTFSYEDESHDSLTLAEVDEVITPLDFEEVAEGVIEADAYDASNPAWIGFAPGQDNETCVGTINAATETLRATLQGVVDKLATAIESIPEAIDAGTMTESLKTKVTEYKDTILKNFEDAKNNADTTLKEFNTNIFEATVTDEAEYINNFDYTSAAEDSSK